MAKQQNKVDIAKKEKGSGKDDTVIGSYVCTVCGANRYSVLRDLPSTDYQGQLPDGTAYTAVERQLIRCLSCGQNGVRMSFVGE